MAKKVKVESDADNDADDWVTDPDSGEPQSQNDPSSEGEDDESGHHESQAPPEQSEGHENHPSEGDGEELEEYQSQTPPEQAASHEDLLSGGQDTDSEDLGLPAPLGPHEDLFSEDEDGKSEEHRSPAPPEQLESHEDLPSEKANDESKERESPTSPEQPATSGTVLPNGPSQHAGPEKSDDPRDSFSWEEEYNAGRRRAKLILPAIKDHQKLPVFSNLTDDDVISSIASVWRGLHAIGIKYAFGDVPFFNLAKGGPADGQWCVNSTGDFIIPLLYNIDMKSIAETHSSVAFREFQAGSMASFKAEAARKVEAGEMNKDETAEDTNFLANSNSVPSEEVRAPPKPPEEPSNEEDRSGLNDLVGHFELIVAKRTSVAGQIKLSVFDSLGGRGHNQIARVVARNVVKSSGYLGDTWPTFTQDELVPCPVQVVPDTCGIHVILNAWMTMFRLRPLRHSADHHGESFYIEAQNLAQKAVQGRVDFSTIIAFLQHNGFCERDDPIAYRRDRRIENSWPNRLARGRCAAMNSDILYTFVNRLKLRQGIPPGPGETTQSTDAYILPQIHASPHDDGKPPNVQSQRHLGNPIDPPQPVPWPEIFESRLSHFIERDSKAPSRSAHSLDDLSAITHEQMIMAIATLWEGRRRRGSKFALATQLTPDRPLQSFGTTRGMLIAPLSFPIPSSSAHFPSPDPAPPQPQHHVLCIAQPDPDPLNLYHLTFLSYLPKPLSYKLIFPFTDRLIRSSGYLGIQADGTILPTPSLTTPLFEAAEIDGPSITNFTHSANLTALSTILNAWVYLLHQNPINSLLPLHDTDQQQSFLNDSLILINLAIAGHLDDLTIMAFLVTYGYIQRPPPPPNPVPPISSSAHVARMDPEKLRRTLARQHNRDRVAAFDASGETIREQDINEVVARNYLDSNDPLHREMARQALIFGHGDVDAADECMWEREGSPDSVQTEEGNGEGVGQMYEGAEDAQQPTGIGSGTKSGKGYGIAKEEAEADVLQRQIQENHRAWIAEREEREHQRRPPGFTEEDEMLLLGYTDQIREEEGSNGEEDEEGDEDAVE